MADDNFTLATFINSWKEYQDHLAEALATLTTEQLALRAAPGLRSVGENALHIVGCRMFWFTEALEEDSGEQLQPYARWNRVALDAPHVSDEEYASALQAPVPTGGELAEGINRTWRFMKDCLARWSPDDLRQTFGSEEDGEASRAWVVWHVLEHDLHHGGEISLTLGMHGIDAEFAV
ncbi:MAG TPA: DinB family protein [Ktedonobacterales bacterium]|jgi:uncharacterized damage-inducible protein DinB